MVKENFQKMTTIELLQHDKVWENNGKHTLRYLVNKLIKDREELQTIIDSLLK